MQTSEENLALHYNNLYQNAINKIGNAEYEIDSLIDDPKDHRFGITLVIRPDADTKQNIQQFLSELKAIEPDQYYYQNSDLHVTVMSIISCYEDFSLDDIVVEDYVNLIDGVLKEFSPFNIQFKGLTASPSCILLQGFLTDTLNEIRDALRKIFKASALQQSIDKRYAIQTAHSTVVRFRNPLSKINELLSLIERYRNFDFGTFEVKQIELVYNDWYQREKFVRTLHTFKTD